MSGNADGIRLNAARVPHAASTTPTAPPANARQTLSVSAWRRMRARLAPSAARTANSCDRRVNRARIRLLTLAHAMSSTNVTVGEEEHQRGLQIADEVLLERQHVDANALVRLGVRGRE